MASKFDQPTDDERDFDLRYIIVRCATPDCEGIVSFPDCEAYCTACLIDHAQRRAQIKADAKS